MSNENSKSAGSQNVVQLALIGLLIVAAFFIGFLWNKVQMMEGSDVGANTVAGNQPSQPTPADPSDAEQVGEVAPVTADDHVRGDRNARIALIEYSDYDCPFCTRFHATAQQVVDEYGGQVMWVYRHFPLDSLHPDARSKAEASECVAKIGGNDKFWEFSDALLDPTAQVAAEDMAGIVSQIGIDQTAYINCVNSGEASDLVNSDFTTGQAAGIRGTPGNIILDIESGEKVLIPGALPFESLKTEIDKLLSN